MLFAVGDTTYAYFMFFGFFWRISISCICMVWNSKDIQQEAIKEPEGTQLRHFGASPLVCWSAWFLPGSDLDLLVRLASGQLGTNLIMNFGADRRAEDSSVGFHRHRRFHLVLVWKSCVPCRVRVQLCLIVFGCSKQQLQCLQSIRSHFCSPLGAGSNSLLCAERREPGSYVKSVSSRDGDAESRLFMASQCPRHACCEHLGTSSFPVALGWHQECCGLRGPFSCWTT